MTPYRHRQHAPLAFLICGLAIACCIGVWISRDPIAEVLLATMAVACVVIAAMFGHLTVRETADHLLVRFGPLPVFGTRVRYDALQACRPARSWLLDGWGVHWLPGRGWTFNLWGRDCVELTMPGGIVRIGTNDPDGLLRHLRARVPSVAN